MEPLQPLEMGEWRHTGVRTGGRGSDRGHGKKDQSQTRRHPSSTMMGREWVWVQWWLHGGGGQSLEVVHALFSLRGKRCTLSMAFRHPTTRKTRVLRFPLDEVDLTQSNNESCQWRMWQESARVSNSLSSYVQIDNYEASPPVQQIKILLVRKPAHV